MTLARSRVFAARRAAGDSIRAIGRPFVSTHGMYIGDGRVLVRTLWGTRMLLPADDLSVMPQLLLYGWYEAWLGHFLRRRLPEGGTFVDVGAHVGTFTVLGAATVGRAGRVIAFEANPRTAEWLRLNVQLNYLEGVEVREAAAWSEAGDVEFQSPLHFSGQGWIGGRDESGHAHSDVATMTVPAETLDALGLERIDVLKIDAEGSEVEVLEGARRLLEERRIGAIAFEFLPRHAGASWERLVDLLVDQERRGATFHYLGWRGRVTKAQPIREIAAHGGATNVIMLSG